MSAFGRCALGVWPSWPGRIGGRLPAGAWSVVRLDSAAAFSALARGGAAALPKVAQLRAGAGGRYELDLKPNPVSDTSASR